MICGSGWSVPLPFPSFNRMLLNPPSGSMHGWHFEERKDRLKIGPFWVHFSHSYTVQAASYSYRCYKRHTDWMSRERSEKFNFNSFSEKARIFTLRSEGHHLFIQFQISFTLSSYNWYVYFSLHFISKHAIWELLGWYSYERGCMRNTVYATCQISVCGESVKACNKVSLYKGEPLGHDENQQL